MISPAPTILESLEMQREARVRVRLQENADKLKTVLEKSFLRSFRNKQRLATKHSRGQLPKLFLSEDEIYRLLNGHKLRYKLFGRPKQYAILKALLEYSAQKLTCKRLTTLTESASPSSVRKTIELLNRECCDALKLSVPLIEGNNQTGYRINGFSIESLY